MIHTDISPDSMCRDCGGTGRIWNPLDCPCLIREAKIPLWRRAIKALVPTSQPRGRSMVAGRRNFLKTLATGAAAAVTATVLPKAPSHDGLYGWHQQVMFLQGRGSGKTQMARDIITAGTAKPIPNFGREHGFANYSIWGSSVIRPELGARLVETA